MNKDSSDAALQRYKQSLLGGATSTAKFPDDPRQIVFEKVELVAEGRTPIVLDIYDPQLAKKPFVLKEGANFHLILYFYVQHDMVSGQTDGAGWADRGHCGKGNASRCGLAVGHWFVLC